MLIHLTGMSPRTASERTRERVTFAGLLERLLYATGHQVDRRPYLDTEPDLAMVGLASVLSPGATYALAGLETLGRAVDDGIPVLLFVDDPMLSKIRASAKSVTRDASRLWSDYLVSKRIRQSRTLTARQKWHIRGAIEVLSEHEWPPVLVPMHAWGAQDPMMSVLIPKRLGVTTDIIPLDVSSALMAVDLYPATKQAQAKIWVTDSHYSKNTLKAERVRWPVVPINSTAMESPEHVYGAARGVHQGLVGGCPGWWTPTPLFAAQAGAAYLMDQDDQNLTGQISPYYLTADDVEANGRVQHEVLVENQRHYLKEHTWNLDDLLLRMADVIGSTSSFVRQDTRTPTSGTS